MGEAIQLTHSNNSERRCRLSGPARLQRQAARGAASRHPSAPQRAARLLPLLWLAQLVPPTTPRRRRSGRWR